MSLKQLTPAGVKGDIFLALDSDMGLGWVEEISLPTDSDSDEEIYPFAGQVPPMREKIGGRQAKKLRDNRVTVINKTYETTLEIPRVFFDRDKTGQIEQRIGELVDKANEHWDREFSTLIIDGEANNSYDNQFYFDTDHEEGSSGSQSNDIEVDISELPVNQNGTATNPSPEEAELSVLQGIQQLYSLKDDQGEPMNQSARKFIVMVPIPFWTAFAAALTNPVLTSGKTNTITSLKQLQIELVPNARLTWTDKFAVFIGDKSMAMIKQTEVGVEISSKLEESDWFKDNDSYQYLLYKRGRGAYGFWQKACLIKLI